jgi:hypothetical protein
MNHHLLLHWMICSRLCFIESHFLLEKLEVPSTQELNLLIHICDMQMSLAQNSKISMLVKFLYISVSLCQYTLASLYGALSWAHPQILQKSNWAMYITSYGFFYYKLSACNCWILLADSSLQQEQTWLSHCTINGTSVAEVTDVKFTSPNRLMFFHYKPE